MEKKAKAEAKRARRNQRKQASERTDTPGDLSASTEIEEPEDRQINEE